MTLRPGDFMLAATSERIQLPSTLLAFVAALSHMARFGLQVTATSLLVSPGFGSGAPTALTLELSSVNPAPLVLRAGMPVCHVVFCAVTPGDPLDVRLARSVYDGLRQPSPPLLYEEFAATLPGLPRAGA
jgi:dCTP deaminase